MTGRTYRAALCAAAIFTLSIISSGPLRAEAPGLPAPSDPAARGLAIAEESGKRDRGWGDAKADMKMVLTNASGETSERALRFMMIENTDGDGNWSLMTFDKPADIEGTALLTYPHVKEADEQWLYLPTVKRVKRISSANKSGPFVGSEFAFEDFSAQQVGKFTYKWLRDEPCGDRTCHVVERTPQYENSGYTRQIVWIDTTDYLFRKTDFYDRKDSLIKTLTYQDYKLYDNKFWRPGELAMANHETKKSTRLVWQSYAFHTGLTKDDFSTASLERAR
ncbi:outer membrane lipoprotein-sorting protein [Parvibaculum sedimenti]|uniref:Outer membrane lipoprotein-sorting protein n=1 Tax=Parvibaculum sedimenti TaxID=2608632 RepID=A0A6N6VJG7_9HYPH|nr:outer membrane lipoprotein-sorting protein [Parvibaculum sedimenti]KAB7740729.1 outer membrane lipoprotein-sorting protein [Parvibaculum sedimenti]